MKHEYVWNRCTTSVLSEYGDEGMSAYHALSVLPQISLSSDNRLRNAGVTCIIDKVRLYCLVQERVAGRENAEQTAE